MLITALPQPYPIRERNFIYTIFFNPVLKIKLILKVNYGSLQRIKKLIMVFIPFEIVFVQSMSFENYPVHNLNVNVCILIVEIITLYFRNLQEEDFSLESYNS